MVIGWNPLIKKDDYLSYIEGKGGWKTFTVTQNAALFVDLL